VTEARTSRPELTLLTLTMDEENAIRQFIETVLPKIKETVPDLEFLVVDGASKDRTAEFAAAAGARVVQQTGPGYGHAYRDGLREARGKRILTMDADCSHPPEYFPELWKRRGEASLVMGSRYLDRSADTRTWFRRTLSVVLNAVFRAILGCPLTDISGGYRLYTKSDLERIRSTAPYYDVVCDVVMQLHGIGCCIIEIPYQYTPRLKDESKARVLVFGISYAKTLLRLWWELRFGRKPSA